MPLNKESDDYRILLQTVWAEARGEFLEGEPLDEEPPKGQLAVAWVIKNRVDLNRDYWGGNSYKGVCLKRGMFECWGEGSINMEEEPGSRDAIDAWLPKFDNWPDPTFSKKYGAGADHYRNPTNEAKPNWEDKCHVICSIANHCFYIDKNHCRR